MTVDDCFLCSPDQRLIYEMGGDFFAMLGIGPIVEGYSIIATKDHIPSTMDLSLEKAEKLSRFTKHIRSRLKPYYGKVIITEHGRVNLGGDPVDNSEHSKHCLHAHRLVFPINTDLTPKLCEFDLPIMEYPSFLEARRNFDWGDEYLYFERTDGSCVVTRAPLELARLFFRKSLAEYVGKPEIADWRQFPRHQLVEEALDKIKKNNKLN